MRWTSPNLYYSEYFFASSKDAFGDDNKAHTDLQPLIRYANITNNVARGACDRSVVFAVTNFDPDDDAGKPNFIDVPPNTVKHFGFWPTMLVRSTTVVSKVATIDKVIAS